MSRDLDPDFQSTGNSKKLEVAIPKQGQELARIYGVAFLGPIYNPQFSSLKNEVMIFFETLSQEAVFFEGEEPRPYGLSRSINYTKGEKSLMATLVAPTLGQSYSDAWFDNFDLKELVGTYCTINIAHYQKRDKTTGYKVTTFASWINGVPKPKGTNEDFYYDPRIHKTCSDEWLRLPIWLRKSLLQNDYSDFEQIKEAGYPIWDKDNKPENTKDEIVFLNHTMWQEEKEKILLANNAPEDNFIPEGTNVEDDGSIDIDEDIF